MSKPNFTAYIATPTAVLYQGPASKVSLVSETGQMQVYPNHAPFVGSIKFSPITLEVENLTEEMWVRTGMVFVDTDKNEIKILAQFGEKTAEINHQSILEYQNYILKELNNPDALNNFQLTFLNEQKSSLEKMLSVSAVNNKKTE